MNKKISVLLCIIMIFGFSAQAFSTDGNAVNTVVTDTAEYLYKSVSNPCVASVGGEWVVLGLARSGVKIPDEYFKIYYENAMEYVAKSGGVLHERKYTEYSRMIIALTAIGKDPQNVAGYDLLKPLGDYEKTIWQGINGSVWALIALDSGNYTIPQNTSARVQATREMYINHILENQLSDGGWSISGNTFDADITAMALQALSKYCENEAVKEAVDKALLNMSENQNKDGGFSSGDAENAESCAQMIIALCELGISLDDTRFVKNGNTMLDNLMTYYNNDKGFKHYISDGRSNQMSTEQCFNSVVAVKRAQEGRSSFYRMEDVKAVADDVSDIIGLAGKNPDVHKMSVVYPEKTFDDIIGHDSRFAVEALAERNIISGKTKDLFEPDSTITRAEFSAIIVKGLGLLQKHSAKFSDVEVGAWYEEYVNTAYYYGIVNGVSKTEFNPNGTVTRGEAAVMIARAAKLCGMNTDMDDSRVRDVLAGFYDYVTVADWAAESLAFCYDKKILSDNAAEIKPAEAVTRSEIAGMLFNMLVSAKLI